MNDQQKAALDFLAPEEYAASCLSYAQKFNQHREIYFSISAEWLRVANAMKGVA